jgi:hypothetical protein
MSARAVALLVPALLIGLSGCSDDEPLATPIAPSEVAATEAPAPSPSPTPSASPSPAPLSPFEDDPAVQSLRAYAAAVAAAVNARDLQLPALRERITSARAERLQSLLGDDLGSHYPGPQPVKVLGVRTVSADVKRILACSVEDGWTLTEPGGSPVQPIRIAGGQYEMVLEGGTWKVDRGVRDDTVSCTGLTLEDFR